MERLSRKKSSKNVKYSIVIKQILKIYYFFLNKFMNVFYGTLGLIIQ